MKLVLVGSGEDFDPDTDAGPRLALGLLGSEARKRWGCADCHAVGCLVYVEWYDARSHGGTSALCTECLSGRLARRPAGASHVE